MMSSGSLSPDTVTAIVLGLLQLGIGLVSLWQQRQLRRAYRTCPHDTGTGLSANLSQRREEKDEDTQFERAMVGSRALSSSWQ
jgi:hypothetical protein